MGFFITFVAMALVIAALWPARRKTRILLAIRITTLFFALPALILGIYWLWFTHRSQPIELNESWFQGITYQRRVLQTPRLIVAHIVTIDLRTPGISFIATHPHDDSNLPLRAQTVSTFARNANAQIAINGDFFNPFRAESPLDYYPHSGDMVQAHGFAAIEGKIYQPSHDYAVTFYIDSNGHPTFEAPLDPPLIAISGNSYLVRNGRPIAKNEASDDQYPRTALGLDRDFRMLFIIVIDGRQPSYSLGMSQPELGQFLLNLGAYNAINFDGGGSSTLVRQINNNWKIVNSPSNFKMPWWERPVANHLGIRANLLK